MKLNRKFILLLLIAVFVLGSPYLLRFSQDNTSLLGEQGYYDLRISKDPGYNPYYNTISFLGQHLGFQLTGYILPLFLGLFSLLLFYNLLRETQVEERFWISLLLIISPIFIYSFTFLNKHSFAIFLILLGFNLLGFRKWWWLALPVFAMLPFISIISCFFALILLLNYSILYKKSSSKVKYTVLFLLLTFIFAAVLNPTMLLERSFFQPVFEDFISDLGGLIGFGVFGAILFLVGFFIIWKRKYTMAYISLIFLFLSYLYFGSVVNQYLNFLVYFFAGSSFSYLLNRRWSLDTLKNFSMMVLVSGLLFSPISYTKTVSEYPISEITVDSLLWLKENSEKTDIVLSYYEKSPLIKGISERETFFDEELYSDKDTLSKINDSAEIFYGHDLEKTKQLLEKNSIRYIWIDNDAGKSIWERPEQGLLFLFRNSETFKKVYNQKEIEIWQVLE